MFEEDEAPLRQKRGESVLFTLESASNRANRMKTRSLHTYAYDVSDIDGTRPGPLYKRNRPPIDYDSIEGTHPKRLIGNRQVPRNSMLDVTDIEGTKPRVRAFRTDRHIDPLQPVYELPPVDDRPITPPKFVRDGFDVADIEGTKTRAIIHLDRPPRDTQLNVKDIATQAFVEKKKKSIKDPINCDDINQKRTYHRNPTNPLEPVYTISPTKLQNTIPCFEPTIQERSFGGTERIGEIAKSKPKRLHRPPDYDGQSTIPDFTLMTEDIEGATQQMHLQKLKREPRPIMDVSDIAGTSSTTGKRRTLRTTDPNTRDYSSALIDAESRQAVMESEMVKTRAMNDECGKKLMATATREAVNPILWKPNEYKAPPKNSVHKITRGYEGGAAYADQMKTGRLLPHSADEYRKLHTTHLRLHDDPAHPFTKTGPVQQAQEEMVFDGSRPTSEQQRPPSEQRRQTPQPRSPTGQYPEYIEGQSEGPRVKTPVQTREFRGNDTTARQTDMAAGGSGRIPREMPVAPVMQSKAQKEELRRRAAVERMQNSTSHGMKRSDVTSAQPIPQAQQMASQRMSASSYGHSSQGRQRQSGQSRRDREQLLEDLRTLKSLH
ncbi:hypothetical protein BLNAU_13186 [Blattamonas nauphoetae]|uniref:Uncharacterized protein n=1 Tax=Blattamonas nauphoetae TaxID=2049346 RepID=A0ABQ9XH81_9EUKA|nr:hypothetical protein BLNAU_13186 [Blattamonas nauphoetae]